MTIDEPVQEPPVPAGPKPEASIPVRKLVMGLAGVVVAVVVGWFGWSQYTTHQQAEKTKQLSEQVRQLIQTRIDSLPEQAKYGVQVDNVSLIKQSDTMYTGMVTLHSRNVSQRQAAVEVTSDGSTTMWQFDERSKGILMSLLD